MSGYSTGAGDVLLLTYGKSTTGTSNANSALCEAYSTTLESNNLDNVNIDPELVDEIVRESFANTSISTKPTLEAGKSNTKSATLDCDVESIQDLPKDAEVVPDTSAARASSYRDHVLRERAKRKDARRARKTEKDYLICLRHDYEVHMEGYRVDGDISNKILVISARSKGRALNLARPMYTKPWKVAWIFPIDELRNDPTSVW